MLDLLSVGAAYGVLVWIFQGGHLQGLLGFHSNGGIVAWLPLFLFSVLFGLSMDYHVFILSRIRELVDRGLSTEEAVSRDPHDRQHGDERRDRDGGRVRHLRDALDARPQADGRRPRRRGAARSTIIRGVLLPATMKLLGDWNWYLPRALRWLPSIELERAPRVGANAVDAS